jgi:hypothetical protein
VTIDVEQGSRGVANGVFDWARAEDGVLHAAMLLEPRISGNVVVKVGGTTGDGQPTASHAHPMVVIPGQTAPTVRVVLLPPP